MVGYLMELNNYFFIFSALVFFQMFFLQLRKLNIQKTSSCLNTFKSNNLLGLIVFVALVTGKL